MVTIHNLEQGSDEWFDIRQPLYTASEAEKLLRRGKFKKEASSFTGNFYTERGKVLEVEALELYHQIKGTQSLPHGFITNSKYPNAGASPDDLTDTTYVEVKAFNVERHMACAKEIFSTVMAQIQFGLMVAEYKLADLILYNPKMENPKDCLIILPIKANPKAHANFKRILA